MIKKSESLWGIVKGFPAWRCTICGKKFASKRQGLLHNRRKHNKTGDET